jgi:hypothetical protein
VINDRLALADSAQEVLAVVHRQPNSDRQVLLDLVGGIDDFG